MQMLILAGGFGTRLRSAVHEVPKALAPVGSIPFLHYQLENWTAQGARSFVFLLHHQADAIVNFLEREKNGLLLDCRVRWVVEPKPMDTGGAIANAVRHLGLQGDFIIANADTWIGTGAKRLSEFSAPIIAVIRLQNPSRYGRVDFDSGMTVTAFDEKGDIRTPGWINAGLGLFNVELFEDWDGAPFSLERDCLPQLVERRVLKAFQIETEFIDIGVPDDYRLFCQWIASGREGDL